MATDRPGPSIRISDILRSGLALIILLGVLGFLAGLLLASRSKESSTATTPILVNPLDGNPFYPSTRGEQLINLESEAQAVRSSGVAKKVEAKVGGDLTADELLENVTVAVPVNTQILEISYKDADPATAEKVSQAFADSYLEFRHERAQQQITEQSGQLQAQIDTNQTQLESLATQLAVTPPNSAQATILQQAIQGVSSQITTMSVRQSELTATALDPGQVVVPAKLEAKGSINTKLLLPAAGLIGGALVGFVIAILRAQANPTVSRREDLDELGVKVLGTWSPVLPGAAPDEVHLEEVRRICVALLALQRTRPFSILFTPVGSSSHHAAVVLELGRALSITGSADDRGRRDQQQGVRRSESGHGSDLGLSEVMSRDVSLTDVLVEIGSDLWLLPPGRDLDQGSDLFVGEALARALTAAKNRCDVVLVAGGSMDDSHAQALATCVDGVVFEVEEAVATRSAMNSASNATELFGSGLLGAVFISHTPVSRFGRSSAVGRRLAGRLQRIGRRDPRFRTGRRSTPTHPWSPTRPKAARVDEDRVPADARPSTRRPGHRPWTLGRERRRGRGRPGDRTPRRRRPLGHVGRMVRMSPRFPREIDRPAGGHPDPDRRCGSDGGQAWRTGSLRRRVPNSVASPAAARSIWWEPSLPRSEASSSSFS